MRGLLQVGGAALVASIAFALCWAWFHRGAIQLLPFEGNDGAAISLRLAHELENIALGSTSDIGVDPSLQIDGDGGPPPVTLPGTGLSFASLVGFIQVGRLAETRIHGALIGQDKTYQVWLQVCGPDGVTAISSDMAPDANQALVQAAEGLYGQLKPVAFASYLFRRDPNRCRQVISDILRNPHRQEDETAAYRIWGLVLSDEGDFEGARQKFREAIAKTTSAKTAAQRFKARAWVDLGHTYRWEHRWRDAADAYRTAATFDHDWEVPYNFLGDAAQGGGDWEEAKRWYLEAIRLNSHYVEPWNGLGRLYMAQTRYEDAIDAYTTARQLQLQLDHTAAFTYYGLGDALFRVGCGDAASEQYDRAVVIDPSFEAARHDWEQTRTCQVPRSPDSDSVSPWRPGQEPTVHGDTPCLSSNVREEPSVPS